MHRLGVASVVVLVALLGGVSAGVASSAAGAKTRITFVTPLVSPGGTLTIKAAAPPGARCVAVISLHAHSVAQLASHVPRGGRTSWTYRLAASAKLGTYRAAVSCTRGGGAFAAFKVGAPPIAPALISVVKSGFSVETFGSQTFLHCGIQLQNTSITDARSLVITVTFADTQGRSLATTEVDLTVIPAGQVFYASCLKLTNVTLAVSSVQVQVKVGKSTAHTGKLPLVTDLKLTPDQYGGTQTLSGSFTNPYSTPMSEDAAIYAVYYDSGGNIIGGDWTQAGASVQPGSTVGFSFPYLDARIASAQVSVDPCGSAALFNQCQVP
jgi:hypothetical protein